MPRPLLVGIVAAGGLLELAAFVIALATYNFPVAEYGYNIGYDGRTVIAVEPGLPAARAGIRPGDVFDYRHLSLPGRVNAILSEPVLPGTSLNVTAARNGNERNITLLPAAMPWIYGMSNISYALAGFALAAVSLGLLLLRPSRMTLGFAFVAPPLLLPGVLGIWAQTTPPLAGFVISCAIGVVYALQATGIMIFASRFPSDCPSGINRIIDRLAIPLGLAFAVVYLSVYWSIWFSSQPPLAYVLAIQDFVAPILPSAAALIALIATYAVSDPNLRSRLAPTLVAFVLLIVTSAVQTVEIELSSNPGIIVLLYFAFSLAAGLVAVAVAYAVVRHRVIDVSFIVGRTLVYTILTLFAVSVFTLIEFFVGKLLEHNGLAIVLEIVAALALGLSLNALHNRLDNFIDRVLFRRRHLAEARLERAALALPHAGTTELVADMLVAEPADAFDLASAAVFALSDDERHYMRRRSAGWAPSDAADLDLDDRLVVRLRAELRAVHLEDVRWPRGDVPTGNHQPLYAVPVAAGNRLEAIVLYGGHGTGEALDPDERRSLRALARGAALAYDHLRAQALRKSLQEAHGENAALRRVERTLTSLLKQRLNESSGTPRPSTARPEPLLGEQSELKGRPAQDDIDVP